MTASGTSARPGPALSPRSPTPVSTTWPGSPGTARTGCRTAGQRAAFLKVPDLLVRDLDALGIAAGVHLGCDGQPGAGGGRGDGLDDDLVAGQGAAAPAPGDGGGQPVLGLVPLAGAGWQVAGGDLQPGADVRPGELGLP